MRVGRLWMIGWKSGWKIKVRNEGFRLLATDNSFIIHVLLYKRVGLNMEVVADASAIIAVVTNERRRQALIRSSDGADLIAPASVHWEIGNALSAMLKRGRISLNQVTSALIAYEQIPIRFVDVELDQSLSIAAEYDLYAYDAFLLRCSLKYRSPILTLDRGLAHAAKQLHVEIVEVE